MAWKGVIRMKKMLIVDDDVHLRKLVRTYAELEDFQCTEADGKFGRYHDPVWRFLYSDGGAAGKGRG